MSKCCNKVQHKSLEKILYKKILKYFIKNINKQNKLEVISVSKHLTELWRGYVQRKYQIISRIINNIKKLFFFLCIYKMANITRETYEANGMEVIADKLGKLWLNERHVEKK